MEREEGIIELTAKVTMNQRGYVEITCDQREKIYKQSYLVKRCHQLMKSRPIERIKEMGALTIFFFPFSFSNFILGE